jgi:N-sulfoglucosamine sulfohydrolase
VNILLITADDLNCSSVGAYGCDVPGVTPNIDRLASEGVRFEHGHVTIAVCQPSRGALATGRYPHRSGIEGFNHIEGDMPVITEQLRAGGYLCGILGKVGHSTPKTAFRWDMSLDMGKLGYGRGPEVYRRHAKDFIEQAAREGKPFYLMANSHDPHRPFFGNDRADWYEPGPRPSAAQPSRVFGPEEIKVPGFLPDLPEVRREIAEYYSSARRCDDTVGAILRALAESGEEPNTLVMFLSDNGMALPFAKTNCYLHSTHTPWIVRWPGIVEPGRACAEHFVSGIDFMPTVLDAAGLPLPEGMDGVSFVPVLKGQRQDGRDVVFTQFHQTAGCKRYPMRCVQDTRFGYIFSPWSDGERVFKNESQSGRTMKAMQEAAATDPVVAGRVELFLRRVPEELYDFRDDPDARRNLVDDPRYVPDLDRLRTRLEAWMERTADPALEAFRDRESPEALAKFMAEEESRAKQTRRRNRKKAGLEP